MYFTNYLTLFLFLSLAHSLPSTVHDDESELVPLLSELPFTEYDLQGTSDPLQEINYILTAAHDGIHPHHHLILKLPWFNCSLGWAQFENILSSHGVSQGLVELDEPIILSQSAGPSTLSQSAGPSTVIQFLFSFEFGQGDLQPILPSIQGSFYPIYRVSLDHPDQMLLPRSRRLESVSIQGFISWPSFRALMTDSLSSIRELSITHGSDDSHAVGLIVWAMDACPRLETVIVSLLAETAQFHTIFVKAKDLLWSRDNLKLKIRVIAADVDLIKATLNHLMSVHFWEWGERQSFKETVQFYLNDELVTTQFTLTDSLRRILNPWNSDSSYSPEEDLETGVMASFPDLMDDYTNDDDDDDIDLVQYLVVGFRVVKGTRQFVIYVLGRGIAGALSLALLSSYINSYYYYINHNALDPYDMALRGFLAFLLSNAGTALISVISHLLIAMTLPAPTSPTVQDVYNVHAVISEMVLNAFLANWLVSHSPEHEPRIFQRLLMALYTSFSIVPWQHLFTRYLQGRLPKWINVLILVLVIPIYGAVASSYMFGIDRIGCLILAILGNAPSQGLVPLLINMANNKE